MFMVVSWARAIMSIPKRAWTFPARPYYYILFFLKINRKPKNNKTEGRKGHTGPPGQPRGEELPCRFLLHPGGSRGDILGPRGSPMWGIAALQIPLSSQQQPTPVFLPEKFHGQKSLEGYNPRGCEESDTTEQLSTHTLLTIVTMSPYRT